MKKRLYSILVVDDNPADLFIIQEAFSECGFRCQLKMASSPEEARDVLSKESFDLLLSDFGADPDEGQSFIRSVRAQRPSLPIIVLSGSYNSASAYRSGANAFVRKPGNLAEFTAKIRGIMQFWADVAELPPTSITVNHEIYIG